LRRLSVFAGGWTLEAAETVCAGEGIEAREVLDLLTSLVEKSLLQYEEADAEGRYRLLETVRQYGAEKLCGAGEEVEYRGRHRDSYLTLAEQAEPELRGPAQGEWLARLEQEHENLRAALAWSTERSEGEAGLRLGGALWRFWMVRDFWAEGRERLAGVLALPGVETRTAARGSALNGAGVLAQCQGDYQAARALYGESLAIRRQLGDQQAVASSLSNLGNVASDLGDYATARALLENSQTIYCQLGDQHGIATSLHNLGCVTRDQGEYEAARAFYEESLAIYRQLGKQREIANSLANLGFVTRLLATMRRRGRSMRRAWQSAVS
jgi:non-specific serine/threonine protein kinase